MDLGEGAAVVLRVEHGGGLLFGDGQAAADETPVFFGFAHLALVAHCARAYSIEEREDEVGGLCEVALGGVGVAVADAERQQGVVEYATTYHVVRYLGEAVAQQTIVGRGEDVAIVDDRVVEEGQHLSEGVEVDLSAVLLSACARVDGDVGKGVVVEDGDDGENLMRAVKSEAHLDAETGLEVGYHLIEYAAYLVGVGEDAAAAVFGGDAAHGAADVPVYFGVAHVVEAVGEVGKLKGFFA